MARKKKVVTQDEGILLSEAEVKQVWDFFQFSQSYNNAAINPMMLNQQMQSMTLNPMSPTQAQLDQALLNPKDSETQLQSISEYFEIVSQPYKRLLSFLGNMLSWDLVYTPTNYEKGDSGNSNYKKSEKAIEEFLNKFDYKKEFTKVVRQMLRNETFFGSPRFDMSNDTYILQELPSSPIYTKITGRFSHGLLGSLNMYFFMLPGVDLDMFHPFFKKKFNEFWKSNNGLQKNNPSIAPQLRALSSWVYWQDMPPSANFTWKMTEELATRLPYFSGLFSDLILQGLMRNLQKNVNMAVASRLLLGSVTLLKDQGAKVANALSISPENLGRFLALVKSAVGEAVKVAAAPLEGMQSVNFASDNELYPQYLKTMLASSGVNTNLIFTSDVKANVLESQLGLSVDEQLMTSLYPQFNSFLNYYVNQEKNIEKNKWRWKFEFEGTSFFTNKEERLTKQKDMMAQGVVLPRKISSALGMRYQDFKTQMLISKDEGFTDELTPIVQAAQLSGKDGAGAPPKSDSKISESGAETKGSGSNIGRGGKAVK